MAICLPIPGQVLAKNIFDYDSVWSCDQTKRNWYCDEQPQPVKPQSPPLTVKKSEPDKESKPRIRNLSDLKTAEEMRQELKVRLDLATMYPTEQNLKNYMEAQKLVNDKSSLFTDQWRRVVWKYPELDYSQQSPTNNAAIQVHNQQRQEDRERYLATLSKEHGLIFFFRSDCPYCYTLAPTLKMLSRQFGIEVLGVSIDGGGLPDFPKPADGRKVAAQWGVEKVPALFIASKKNKDYAPIGFGVMSLTEIIDRIYILTNTQPGDEF